MIRVNHYLKESDARNTAMLLPLGDYLNYDLSQAEIGDEVKFMDGGISKILHVSVIKRNSKEAEGMAIALYGLPLDTILSVMTQNWKTDAKKDSLILLVVERNEK